MNNEKLFVRLYFSVIDRWLFDPKKRYIALVYIYLCRQANIYTISERDGIKILPWTVAITQPEISKEIQISIKQVRNALRTLEENKLIKIDNETAKNRFLIIRIRVLYDQRADPKTAETLANTCSDELAEHEKGRPSQKRADQRADPKTAETLAIAALGALRK